MSPGEFQDMQGMVTIDVVLPGGDGGYRDFESTQTHRLNGLFYETFIENKAEEDFIESVITKVEYTDSVDDVVSLRDSWTELSMSGNQQAFTLAVSDHYYYNFDNRYLYDSSTMVESMYRTVIERHMLVPLTGPEDQSSGQFPISAMSAISGPFTYRTSLWVDVSSIDHINE